MASTEVETADAGLAGLAAEAFIYGFPMVFDLREVRRFTRQGMGTVPATPLNTFGHARQLTGPNDRFVSINNDTIYSIANVDASGGPVRFQVPDADGRYYVMQFVDAWTNNFAYVGHRATGTAAGAFLLVPPGWDGATPADATVIHLPTAVVSIVGRWAISGERDLPAVRALQYDLSLEPTATGVGLPEPDPDVPQEYLFFEQMRVWMRAFPPAARDRDYQARFAPLGLLEPESPYVDPPAELAAALRVGQEQGKAQMERALRGGTNPEQNGWQVNYHAFDYNLDFFEVGALDDARWKLPDDPSRYLRRALAARAGLWGNHGYEAGYVMTYNDGHGNPLDGSHRYELRFEQPPPCDAFWSVTMYNTPDFFLVDNPIDRYSIGDRTPGLQKDDDGSLTIVIQRERPAEPHRATNWLPTPDGPFRPLLRMYEPREAVLDGAYKLPPITRID